MKSFILDKLQSCNVNTLKGCQPNQVEFIKKNKDKSLEDFQEMKREKESAVKALKKERSDAQAKLKEQEKNWSRTERNLNKALGLIKQFESAAKKGDSAEKKARRRKAAGEDSSEL
mmetsp:Transcript_35497/g.82433  ORF Transcript_35497/g.82433 Transcript_35497/m.82433 type:complete len:116 (-) Transcript_35497:96-443(-)